ncbi:MAG TPA: right-handed parallel beta-helix repeat-containing protein [Candidatus Binatia bacterium]
MMRPGHRSRPILAILALVLLIAAAEPVAAADFTVDTTADTVDVTPGDGVCADAASHCSLRAAVMEANALGDPRSIALAAATYTFTIPPAAPQPTFEPVDADAGDLDVTGDITITGAARDTTIIDANHLSRHFKLDDEFDPNTFAFKRSGKLALAHLTLQNGVGNSSSTTFKLEYGGAIRILQLTQSGTRLTLSDVAIKNCTSPLGGGGLLTFVPVELTDVLFTGNTVVSTTSDEPRGGAILLGIGAAPSVLTRVTVTGNSVANPTGATDALGGGISTVSSSVTIIDSTISGNTASSPRNGEAAGIINAGTLVLNDVDVENNQATGSAAFAGGIENSGGTVVMNGGSLVNNCAAHDTATCTSKTPNNNSEGGGLVNSRCFSEACNQLGPGTFTLTDVLAQQNFAEGSGGVVSNHNGGTVTLNGVQLLNNKAASGGAIYNQDTASIVTIEVSTIDGNAAIDQGGGILNDAHLTVGYSTISNNSVLLGDGGGIESCNGESLAMTNSTVSGNTAAADRFGGGICLTNSATELSFVTVAGNSAFRGGGIYTNGAGLGAKNLKGVLVAGNTAATGPDCDATGLTSLGFNIVGDATSCGIVSTTGDQFGTSGTPIDPALGPLQDNGGTTETCEPANGSVAVNHVPLASCTETSGTVLPNDQRGFTRPAGVACDVGALERDAVEPPATATPTTTSTPLPTPSPTPTGGAATPTATPNPDGVDGYHCHGARSSKGDAKFVPFTNVHAADPFEDVLVTVKKPLALCAPVDPAHDATDLEQYAIKLVKGQPKHTKRTNVRIDDVLGTVRLDTVKAATLLVPTAHDLTSTPIAPDPALHAVDAYQCYKVKVAKGAPKFPRGLEATAGDAFAVTARYLVKKPLALCAPATVNGVAAQHPEYQLCYGVKLARARCADGAPARAGASCKNELDCGGTKKVTTLCQKQPKAPPVPGVFTANQLESGRRLDVTKSAGLCLPSTLVP